MFISKLKPKAPFAYNFRRAFTDFSGVKTIQDKFTVISTLPNGFKIVTNNNIKHNHEVVAMGVYVDAGSRVESKHSLLGLLPGCSKLIEKLSFRTTANFSETDMLNKLELLGGNFQCVANRDSIMYQASCINKQNQVADMLTALRETTVNPRYIESKINDIKDILQIESEFHTPSQKDIVLPELIHQLAFGNETLGSQSTITDPSILHDITMSNLYNYHQAMYTPSNMTLAMVGVKHEDALKLGAELFGDIPPQPTLPKEKPVYKPNNSICIPKKAPVSNPLETFSHIAIAYPTFDIENKDTYTVAVLQSALGGGSSFSSGGPGKGLYSRLYTQVLGRYGWVDHCSAFNYSYKETGLLGMICSVENNATSVVGELLAQQFYNLCVPYTGNGPDSNPDGITDEQVQRAKVQLKSSLLMGLESKIVELEDMGRQVCMLGQRVPIDEMLKNVEKVTLEDCVRVSRQLFVQGRGPTIAMQGDKKEFGDILGKFNNYGLSTKK
ncbi:related to Mitochondrial-processing peptidase subunit alpha [Hanseniaspora guilliermondii]|uniref:Related to Mitochondrial-processing peptidase subunit alpha n=1 Tax=Hanseniaspora guilliermondii TaxID=56406 RepID=A0A1L0FMC8_9ASCO|nr:related to Mitochondrial-processing peptidase subunit alpha [Hanseniaspora guilliermondii]